MLRRTRQLLNKKLRALNVAEKPSVCKTVVEILSKNNFQSVSSYSKYHPIYQFDYPLGNSEYSMYFTSVRGHLMNWSFPAERKKWDLNTIIELYNTKLLRSINPDCEEISVNLKNLSNNIDLLILWLDCDREGENIAFEVIDVVKKVNSKVDIKRAKFSSLTHVEIINAIQNLALPNKNLADGVDIRQNIDLVIGASLTRLQTLTLKDLFYPNIKSVEPKYVLSYGPCQFPTLGFIVDRTERIRKFKSEQFHYIELKLVGTEKNEQNEVKFLWKRWKLFDENFVRTIHEKISEVKIGVIKRVLLLFIQITTKPTYRSRPFPLNTVEFQKLSSRKLKMPSHEAMDIAEKLYNRGYISYPRTETQRYSQSENLKKYISIQIDNPFWGDHANKLLNETRFQYPKKGPLDDKSHPPIHPVKYPPMDSLSEKEVKVYELITRHFLASVSPDAQAEETIIEVEIAEEEFSAKGLTILDLGFFEVFKYDKWEGSILPKFNLNDNISPEIKLNSGKTTAPPFLSEADLITLMDKNGIGTDATIHEHIKTVQERGYAFLMGGYFKPSLIGTTLVRMYEHIGIDLYKPYLRANMEREIKEVCDGNKVKDSVLLDMKENMKLIFNKVYQSMNPMREFVSKYLSENMNYNKEINLYNEDTKNFMTNLKSSNKNYVDQSLEGKKELFEKKTIEPNTIIGTCPVCQTGNIRVIVSKSNNYFIGCSNFPNCIHTANFDSTPSKITKTDENCEHCQEKGDKYPLFSIEYENNSKESICLGKCFKHNKPKKQNTETTDKYIKKSYKNNYEKSDKFNSYGKPFKKYNKNKEENSNLENSYNNNSYKNNYENSSKNESYKKPYKKYNKYKDENSNVEKSYTKSYKSYPKKVEEKEETDTVGNEELKINSSLKKGKVCVVCGISGRHPKDSNCLGLKKNQKEVNEEGTEKNYKKKEKKNSVNDEDDFII